MDTRKFADMVKLAAEAPSESLPQDQQTRAELLTALRKLTASLEDPMHSILRLLFQVCSSRTTSQIKRTPVSESLLTLARTSRIRTVSFALRFPSIFLPW